MWATGVTCRPDTSQVTGLWSAQTGKLRPNHKEGEHAKVTTVITEKVRIKLSPKPRLVLMNHLLPPAELWPLESNAAQAGGRQRLWTERTNRACRQRTKSQAHKGLG